MAKLQQIRHDYIRYANVWEDATILIQALAQPPGARYLSIASGGDNAFMLLTKAPELVVAVDINLPQLHVCALKKAAIQAFDRDQYLAFVGFSPSDQRRVWFDQLKGALSPETAMYWTDHIDLLEKGLIYSGKFERYFRLFARWILPFIHSKQAVRRLLSAKSAESQQAFYDQHWNTWRWRLLFKLFFSRTVMGWAGRDPAFFEEVELAVGQHIFEKAARHLRSVQAQQNHILQFNLCGHFGEKLPDYVQPEHYDRIKAQLDRLVLHHGMVESAITTWGPFDAFNLSNIFEYMDEATCRLVGAQLLAGARPGARLAYWNLMVPRNLVNLFPAQLSDDVEMAAALTAIDRGFFYNQLIINTLKQ